MVKKVRISKLVLDERLYPRTHLNNYHVQQLMEAIKAGTRFPPIVIDNASNKVVDGWHRIEAKRRINGSEAMIEAEAREYKSEADMFQDAILLNASHGEALTPMDQAHCLARAQDFKLEQATVAGMLNITVQRAEGLVQTRIASSGQGNVVLKGSTAWMAGRRLNPEQVAYNRKAGGLPQTFYINQVTAMLESDSVNWDDPKLVASLKKLLDILQAHLKPESSTSVRAVTPKP